MSVETSPSTDPVPEEPLPPDQLPGSSGIGLPTPYADLPRPGRKGDGAAAIPFDPLGYGVLSSLAEVEQKPEKNDQTLTKAQIDAARRKAHFIAKYSTLEGMYAQHPELVRVGRLRVERIQPQWAEDAYGQKVRVCGTLDFRHPCVSSETFARTFGGFKYRVFGMVDQENRENQGGPPQPVEIAVAEFEVPVQPNLDNLPIAAVDMGAAEMPPVHPMFAPMNATPYGKRAGMPTPQFPFYPPAAAPAAMPIEPVLNFAATAMRQPAAPPVSDAVWKVLASANETSAQAIREASASNARILEQRLEATERQVELERQRALEAQNRPTDMVQMVRSVAELTAAQKGGLDSDAMRQLRDDHDRQLRHEKDAHERLIARLNEEHARALQQQRDDNERLITREREASEMKLRIADQRIADLERRAQEQERYLNSEAERKERLARDEMQRILDMRERENAARISEMKEARARELSELKEAQARELASISAMHDRELRMRDTLQNNTQQTTSTAHDIEVRNLQNEISKLTAELADKKRIVEEHLAEKNRPLLEQVQEIQATQAALQEIAGGGKEDDDDDDKPGERKWYQEPIVMEVAKMALAKGADAIPKLMEKVGTGAVPAASAPAAMGPRMAPAAMPMARPRTALPPRRRNRVMFSDADGTPLRTSADLPSPRPTPGDMSQKTGAPRQFDIEPPAMDMGGPMTPLQPPPARPSMPPQQPAARPVQQQSVAPATPPAAQAQPAAAAPAEDWSAFGWMPMDLSESAMFIGHLEQAHAAEMPPAALVQLFCDRFPMEMVAQIPSLIPIDKFIETLRVCPVTKGRKISGGGGRRYLTDVWKLLNERIEAWKKEPAAAEPPAPAQTEEASGEASDKEPS